jgi:hypothetical protein
MLKKNSFRILLAVTGMYALGMVPAFAQEVMSPNGLFPHHHHHGHHHHHHGGLANGNGWGRSASNARSNLPANGD